MVSGWLDTPDKEYQFNFSFNPTEEAIQNTREIGVESEKGQGGQIDSDGDKLWKAVFLDRTAQMNQK